MGVTTVLLLFVSIMIPIFFFALDQRRKRRQAAERDRA